MRYEGCGFKKRLEKYFEDNPERNYIIISGPDLAGKNTFAQRIAKYIEKNFGKKCYVFEALDGPFGKLARFSLERGLKSKMAKATQSIGMLGSYYLNKMTKAYPMGKLGYQIIQIRGSPYDAASILKKESLESMLVWSGINFLSKMTKDADNITLVGDGKELMDRVEQDLERKLMARQTYETQEDIDRTSWIITQMYRYLQRFEDRGCDVWFPTTHNKGFLSPQDERAINNDKKDKENMAEAYERLESALGRSSVIGKEMVKKAGGFIKKLKDIFHETGLEEGVREIDNEIKQEKENHD